MTRRTRIGAIYRKELIDILRDRRTLMAMIVIPVAMYPLLMIAFFRAAESGQERLQAEKFVVETPDAATRDEVRGIIDAVDHARDAEAKRPTFDLRIAPAAGPSAIGDDVHARITLSDVPSPPPLPARLEVEITYNEVNARSMTAMEQLTKVFNRYREQITRDSLRQVLRELPQKPHEGDVDLILQPVQVNTVSAASERQRGGWALGQIVPMILVLMTITGAIYPAIDLTAGERERGTLETLIVTPVPILHLIIGKFLVVATVGLITAALNVASVAATMHFGGLTRAISAEMPIQIPVVIFPLILVCLIPFALLFSAILVAVCSFARTFKEAQNYVMPVIIIAMVPAFSVMLPGVRLKGVLLVLPVGNMVLLTRELFQQTYTVSQILIVVFSTTLYAAAALGVAAKLFGKEAVLFADSRSYRVLFSRRYFEPLPRPTGAQALLLAALLFPACFYAQSLLAEATHDSFIKMMGWLTLVQFGGLFIVLPLAITTYFKIDPVETFRLRLPPLRAVLAAVMIGSSSWLLANVAVQLQERVLPPSKVLEEFGRQIEAQLGSVPLWQVLLLIAIVPAVCEEFLFRGFLLSGLASSTRKWSAIWAAAFIFGLYHFLIDKVPVTMLLGVVLAYTCWQSRSIFPGMLIHAMHNGIGVLLMALPRWVQAESHGRLANLVRSLETPGLPPSRILIPAIFLFAGGLALLASLRSAVEHSRPEA
jgi:sodium transport system permease protein